MKAAVMKMGCHANSDESGSNAANEGCICRMSICVFFRLHVCVCVCVCVCVFMCVCVGMYVGISCRGGRLDLCAGCFVCVHVFHWVKTVYSLVMQTAARMDCLPPMQ
jgi:hypothetical protein